jgi:hypothetical protein
MMLILFTKLFIAHLFGDFVLFRRNRLKEKGKKLWRSKWLVLHSTVHFIAASIALWDIRYLPYALVIGLSHYIGDLACGTMSHRHPQLWFAADQAFHVVVLSVIAALVTDSQLTDFVLSFDVSWIAVAGFVAVTFPAAKLISVFLSQWPPARASEKLKGMASAGLWIGILERVLIYLFIFTGHWEGVGFLLAAKSIFRFGDLTSSKDIYLTEYIMVGTLLSFCLAVVTGLLAIYLNV